MTDRDNLLHFPGGPGESDDDRELIARLNASYATTPATGADNLARYTAAVLREAAKERGRSTDGAPLEAPREVSRPFSLRPRWWWGAAAAALLVVVVSRPWRPDVSIREADSAFAAASAPDATTPRGSTIDESATKEVALVGDFNGWDENATPMIRRGADGAWSARVPLPPGRHVYAFVVDGRRWLVDPLAPQVPDAGYGPTNALIVEGTH